MSELPPPDLMEQGGRARRLVLALLVAVACAVLAYLAARYLAAEDLRPRPGDFASGHTARTYRFVYSVTGLAGAIGFSITLAVANARAKKRWRDERVAKAQVVR